MLGGVAVLLSVLSLTGTRSDGRILYITGESGDSGPTPRLMVMDADGGRRRLWRGWVYAGAFAPDGRSIAYVVSGRHGLEIRVGGARDRLFVRNGSDVAWSATGAIAFVRGQDVWIKDRTERRLVRNGRYPRWSPDGKHVAFVRGTDIWVVGLAGDAARRVIRNGDDPAWSPDGRRIAFDREVGAHSFIFVARSDGTAARRLFRGDAPVWSPDGQELAFEGPRRPNGIFDSIIRARLDGGGRRVIFADRGYCACRYLDWGPRR